MLCCLWIFGYQSMNCPLYVSMIQCRVWHEKRPSEYKNGLRLKSSSGEGGFKLDFHCSDLDLASEIRFEFLSC